MNLSFNRRKENALTHKDLDVWKLSIALVKDIYMLTETLPATEKFALSSQMQRSAISIPSNIAEGAARRYIKEYIQFLYISLGSLSELETQVIIALEIGYINENKIYLQNIEIIRKKLLNFIKYKKETI